MKLAIVSLNQAWEDKKANLIFSKQYIHKASQSGAELIVFPEMTLTGFSNNINLTAENFENSQTIKNFSILAKEFNIGIVFGVAIQDKAKAFNKSILMDQNGEVLGEYSKVHPFSFAGEDKYFNAGSKL